MVAEISPEAVQSQALLSGIRIPRERAEVIAGILADLAKKVEAMDRIIDQDDAPVTTFRVRGDEHA